MIESKKQWLLELSARIREARQNAGYTQAEMGDYLGIGEKCYGFLENGRRDMKTAELAALADKLEVSIDFLLRGVTPGNETAIKELPLSDKAINALREMDERKVYAVNRLMESNEIDELMLCLAEYQADTAGALYYKHAPAGEVEKHFMIPAQGCLQKASTILGRIFQAKDENDLCRPRREESREDITINIEKLIDTMPEDKLTEVLELLEFVEEYRR